MFSVDTDTDINYTLGVEEFIINFKSNGVSQEKENS